MRPFSSFTRVSRLVRSAAMQTKLIKRVMGRKTTKQKSDFILLTLFGMTSSSTILSNIALLHSFPLCHFLAQASAWRLCCSCCSLAVCFLSSWFTRSFAAVADATATAELTPKMMRSKNKKSYCTSTQICVTGSERACNRCIIDLCVLVVDN